MEDPTLLLKRAIAAGARIEVGAKVVLGENLVDAGEESSYINTRKKPYSIGAVAYLRVNRDMEHVEYLMKCKEQEIEPVSYVDRDRILEDLENVPRQTYLEVELPCLEESNYSEVLRVYESISRRGEKKYILVPSSPYAALTLENAKSFLEKGKYQRGGGVLAKEDSVEIEHLGRTYMVLTSGVPLEETEWSHVHAIFVDGSAWQFRGWRGNLPLLFKGRAVFYLSQAGEKIPEAIKSIGARVLEVDGTLLSAKIAQKAFWNTVDRSNL
jgi:RNA pol II accessory factor, Cdc73 family, C-terminal